MSSRNSPSILWLATVSALLLVMFARTSSATALTYNVAAHEKACFYVYADEPGKKIAFYFAVQSGGSFDIDYVVKTARDRIAIQGERERQGDFVFTANYQGEYSFCFSNDMSTFAEKMVDFEITVENEVRPTNFKEGSLPPQSLGIMEESIFRLSNSLNNIARTQKYFRTRENRNFSTVVSTETRIFYFALAESICIIIMSLIDVFVVKNLFNVKRGHV